MVEALGKGVQIVPLTEPIARPIVTVVSSVPPGSVSTADVSVTVMEPPPCPTAKLLTALCRTPFTGGGTVPGKTSVVEATVGVVVVLELPLSQATVVNASASAIGMN